MGSVSSTNPGVANLLEMLANSGSPVLNSTRVTSALQQAPASDIVQLSKTATEAQNLDALFGISNGADGGASASAASAANLFTGSADATSPPANATANSLLTSAALADASPTDALAYYQSAAEAAQTQGLIGAYAYGSQSGSLVDVVG